MLKTPKIILPDEVTRDINLEDGQNSGAVYCFRPGSREAIFVQTGYRRGLEVKKRDNDNGKA